LATLERAIEIAAQAHTGQKDKAGMPYILHPIRVMLAQKDETARIVAVLHDVIEDTSWTIERLSEEGFSQTILDAIVSVSRVDTESYDEFVLRAMSNPIGRAVKKADLEDNLDISRIPDPTPKDYKRLEKYRKALKLFENRE
jgi:(p)ppGpp synthase/HD superfamily hydrolase